MILPVLVPTEVGIPIREGVSALTMLVVVLPLPFIHITVGTEQDPEAVFARLIPLANIGLPTLLPLAPALPDAINEVSFIVLIR